MDKTTKAPPAPPRARALIASSSRVGATLAIAAATMAIAPLTRGAPDASQPQERGTPPPARGTRAASFTPSTYNATARTVEAVFSAGTAVNRWYGTEALTISEEAIDLTRVAAGLCPLLNSHNPRDLDAVLGRVLDARIESGQLVGTFLFADTDAGRAAEGRVARGEVLGISVGYIVRTWTLTESTDERDTWTATRWELLEVSLVAVPADPNAGVRSAPGEAPGKAATTTTETHEVDDMQIRSAGVGAGIVPPAAAAAPAADAQNRTAPATTAATDTTTTVVAVTGTDVRTAATNAGLGDDVVIDLVVRHADTPFTRDALMADIGRRFAERDSSAPTHNRVPATAGGNVTIARAMEDAVVHRMVPGAQLTEAGRNFRGMGMLRMAEELLSSSGINTRGMTPNEIAERALHTTSDFPALMSSAMNRRLRQAYEEHQPTYRRWARRAPNAPNFKAVDVVQMSAMPDLLKVNEAGEFRYGTASDGKVSYALISYGRIIGQSRQLIINDDLNALDRAMTGFAAAGARLENRTVYSRLTANTAFTDGEKLFSAAHKNLGAASGIDATSLGAGRARMRKQKGLQGEDLNLAPSYLIVPTDLEQVAYQFTSSQFVPALAGDVNEFRQGGRTALEPIVEPVLDGDSTTAWYLLANSSQVDTVEYAYLEGAEGVQLSSRLGFTVDGVEIKASLDFAASEIDWRGMDKNPGK